MPVGAILGAAAGIGGALLSSSSTKKAANTAANAQITAARETNALARELYDRNTANFQPFMQSGTRANALIDSFLYGPASSPPAPANNNTVGAISQPQTYYPNQGGGYRIGQSRDPGATNALIDVDRTSPTYDMATGQLIARPNAAQGTTLPAPASSPVQSGMNGWEAFYRSPVYTFGLNEGMNALNNNYAGINALQSGAAIRDAVKFGQDYGSGRLFDFLGLAQGQQALGAGAASSLAGVGNDFLSSVTANNGRSADAQSNAALLRNQANQNLYGGVANALGGFASSFKF